MIRVLSREPDRSMLGLSHCKSKESRWFTFSVQSYFSMEVAKLVTQPFCRKHHVSMAVSMSKNLCFDPSRLLLPSSSFARFRGVANIVGWVRGQLTWPSRVPLRTSCSAILNSSSKWDQQRGGLGV